MLQIFNSGDKLGPIVSLWASPKNSLNTFKLYSIVLNKQVAYCVLPETTTELPNTSAR
jgi:hypothetical protein